MKYILSSKGLISLTAAAVLLAAGIAYAAQQIFDVAVQGDILLSVSAEDPLQVYSGDGMTPIDSGDSVDFGTVELDYWGTGPIPSIRVLVVNTSQTPEQVVVIGDGGDGVVPVFGPTMDDMVPAPDNSFVLEPEGEPGDSMWGYLGLTFPEPTDGTKSTTIIFRATDEIAPVPDPTATPTPHPGGDPVVDRLKVGMFWERESNDPLLLRDDIPQILPMYEALLVYDFDGVDRPMMATGFEVSPDAKTWTFFLRDDVIWHRDFGGFTAEDIVHTLERAKRDIVEGIDNPFAKSIVSFDIPDPYTITMNFEALNFNVTNALHNRRGVLIQSKAAFNAEGDEGIENNPVGSGPYRFVNRGTGEFILFEEVPYDHWRVNPDFQELELVVVEEEATRLAAMLAGEIHMAQMGQDLEDTAEANDMTVVAGGDAGIALGGLIGGLFREDGSIPEGSVRQGVFPELPYSDVYHPVTEVPWVHPKVRQAMNKAVNRAEFNEVLLKGRGIPMYVTWFDKSLRGFNQRWEDEFDEKYGYDPDGARTLLAEVEAEIGQPLDWSKTVMPLADRQLIPGLSNMALALDGYSREVGIEIPTSEEDFNPVLSRIFAGNVGGQLWINGFEKATDPIFVEILYYSKNGICCPFFENREYDLIVEELRGVAGLDERDRIIRLAGDILYDNFSTLPLFWLPETYVINPEVVAEYRTGGLLGFGDLEDVVAVRE